MRAALAVLFGLVLSECAFGEISTMCDSSNCLIERKDVAGQVVVIDPTLQVKTTTARASQGYVWGFHSRLDNYADQGENVAVYGQAFKYGHGTVWGGVFETQDFEGSNGAWGLEVDIAGNGPTRLDALRVGLGVLVWRDFLHRTPAWSYQIDYGVWLVAPPGERVSTRFGFRSDIHCTVACVSVKSGERVCFDDSGEICMSFDAQTGFLSLTNRGRKVVSFQMDSGAVVQGQQ